MAAPDLSVFPDFAMIENLSADESSGQNASTQNLPFPFCVRFLGRQWGTLVIGAPSPDDAATTMDQIVQRANAGLVQMGYPPNTCSWTSGACQF
jgi:hypothetical protein